METKICTKKHKEYMRQYRKTEKYRLMHRFTEVKRRALKKDALGEFVISQWKLLIEYYAPNNICPSCEEKVDKLTIDHVIPLALGGLHDVSNIQPLCSFCNSKKNAKHIDYRFDGGLYAKSIKSLQISDSK
jgi:5-methylcytosine-specific restriction endonuclease McrA